MSKVPIPLGSARLPAWGHGRGERPANGSKGVWFQVGEGGDKGGKGAGLCSWGEMRLATQEQGPTREDAQGTKGGEQWPGVSWG